MIVGIDAGGSLIKVAVMEQGTIVCRKYPVASLQEVAAEMNAANGAELWITGGKAAMFAAQLTREPSVIPEFDATCRGVQHLLADRQPHLRRYILTNVGTGTSIHNVDGDKHERIGGTGVGGGTLIGLSRLLTGIAEYDTIVRLAAQGSRDRIDLQVGHIYEGAVPPIPGDLTASNYGRAASALHSLDDVSTEDRLASVAGLVGETVATCSVLAARSHQVPVVVYIGSTLVGNEWLRTVISRYTVLRGAEPVFARQGEYSGALGALLHGLAAGS
ncbi:type II pantothenate kinase [Paenibacillus cymbidii]|uniref:type II pantothenate kinase n=1 Tax=Paenibacillus cymbidii TaxID=1639034 RepID=UPI0010811F27|nr:type II pantothenate kinase [Paenibacillus cymbidii]